MSVFIYLFNFVLFLPIIQYWQKLYKDVHCLLRGNASELKTDNKIKTHQNNYLGQGSAESRNIFQLKSFPKNWLDVDGQCEPLTNENS